MLIFWMGAFLAGTIQFGTAIYGMISPDIDFKFAFPYAFYGAMNIVVGIHGILTGG